MSIRFAPARGSRHDLCAHVLNPRQAAQWRQHAANDNPFAAGAARFDPLLVDALQHFARHGLNAAPRAQVAASGALAAGHHAEFDHWLAITRLFDARLARQTESALVPAQD